MLNKISILIPAKDRAEYLQHTLKTCTTQNYDNLEIIISDDCSQDNTQELINNLRVNDKRIKYYRHEEAIGMRRNFEFALGQVNTGYIIALGADDGILPNGISQLNDLINTCGFPLITWEAPIFKYPMNLKESGQLLIPFNRNSNVINSSEYLKRMVKSLDYLSDIESPMFYVKGAVSIDLVKKVMSRRGDGLFYSCPTPDGFSAIVLAGEVDNFYFSSKPFTLYGMTHKSQGVSYMANGEKGAVTINSFVKSLDIKMHSELGSQEYSPLVALMTADYLLTARDLPGWPGNVGQIDYRKLILKSINELSHGLYSNDRMQRELEILRKIAMQHNLVEYLEEIIVNMKKNMVSEPYSGTGINNRYFILDSCEYSIDNIYDASFASVFIKRFLLDIRPNRLFNILKKSFLYKFSKIINKKKIK